MPQRGLGIGVQFGVFLEIRDGGDGDTEVGGWTPEICAHGASVGAWMYVSNGGMRGWAYGWNRSS